MPDRDPTSIAAAASAPNLAPLLTRAALLFSALAGVKLALMFAYGEYLFQTHWRVEVESYSWVNPAAFYLLALLIGANLWLYADRVAPRGLRAVRAANGGALVMGLVLILITFVDDTPGIRQPPWTDPAWYASLHLFIAPPYLAAWIAAYAAGYVALARKAREHQALRLTAVFAALYFAAGMRDFRGSQEVLLVLDALGMAALLGARLARGPLALRWLLVPGAWVAINVVIYRRYTGDLTKSWASTLLVLFIVGFVLALVLAVQWREDNLPATGWLLPFAVPALVLLSTSNFDFAHGVYNAMCNALTTSRYFVGELATALGLLAVGWLWRRAWPRGPLLWLDVLVVLLIAFALVDARLSQVMRVRLDWPALALSFGETPAMMLKLLRPYLPLVLGATGLLSAIYAALIIAIQRRGARPIASWAGQNTAHFGFAAGVFVLTALAGLFALRRDKVLEPTWALIATTSPYWSQVSARPMDAAAFKSEAERLGFWTRGAGAPVPPAEALAPTERAAGMNVVLIFQESTYDKFLGLFGGTADTEPELSRYRDRMELFPRFFSTFAGSINARFATFTGLYPVQDYEAFTTHRVPVTSLFELLKARGYATSMFYSSSFDYTNFRDFLRGRGLDEQYDADTMPGRTPAQAVSWGVREEVSLGAIQAQLRKYAGGQRPFFLTYVPAAPHNPYDGVPERFLRHPPGAPGDFTPKYLNEMLYMDWVVASILDTLKETGELDHTVVVITADHGELLGENGGPIGHGWAVSPELTNVPLIVMNPHRPGYRVNTAQGSQVDLLPTLADLLEIPLAPEQLYQGDSLYSPRARAPRRMYLNSFQQYGIVEGGTFTCGDRGSGPVAVRCGTWQIAQSGPHASFDKLEPLPEAIEKQDFSFTGFEAFQANLLQNYAHYTSANRPGG